MKINHFHIELMLLRKNVLELIGYIKLLNLNLLMNAYNQQYNYYV